MATATVQFSSEALKTNVHYTISIPEKGPGPYPVVLLLHGHSDSHEAWLQNTKLGLYMRDYELIVVMPDGGTSFYLNLDEPNSFRKWHRQRYEDFIVQDLWRHVHDTYHVQAGGWGIQGNSMGGYGALRLGCKYPERFPSIWAHSGRYFNQSELEEVVPDPDDADVFATVARLTASAYRPEITFDCGVEDYLLDENRRLHAHMEKLGLPHHYIEKPGGHAWTYWDELLPLALDQHKRVLGNINK